MARHGILRRLPALAAILLTVPAVGAEIDWPEGPVGVVSIFAMVAGMQQQVDYCSKAVPATRTGFDAAVRELGPRIMKIGAALLDSPAFADLKQRPTPPFLYDILGDALAAAQEEFEQHDATDICSATLAGMRAMDDGLIRTSLSQSLSGVRNMLASPEGATP